MIMPEHREAFVRRYEQLQRVEHKKPVLDDQEIRQIEYALVESFNSRKSVTLTLYDEIENKRLIGIVSTISTSSRQIKLTVFKDEWYWIDIKDIISASL
ncbi:YolD-like family protein [Paenibacillus shunpengii]|uniref:YolD-like family protein n=1 Tax=Paenibacillus shunpengii TaxID=2054424 RepID=A0ABW5SWW4_9BACL